MKSGPHAPDHDWNCPNMGPGLNTTKENCLYRQAAGHCNADPCTRGMVLAGRKPPKGACTIPGCLKVQRAKSLCGSHYEKNYKRPGMCLVNKCPRKRNKNGYLCTTCERKA